MCKKQFLRHTVSIMSVLEIQCPTIHSVVDEQSLAFSEGMARGRKISNGGASFFMQIALHTTQNWFVTIVAPYLHNEAAQPLAKLLFSHVHELGGCLRQT